MASAKTYSPEQVATTTGISGKTVRGYLRKTYPRPKSAHGTTWVLSAKMYADTVAHFKRRNPEAYKRAQSKRTRAVKKPATPKPEVSS